MGVSLPLRSFYGFDVREITLPVEDASDVLMAFDSGIDLCLAVDALSVLAALEQGHWLIHSRLLPDLPEAA